MEINSIKILLYFAHPAQYLFMRRALKILESKGDCVTVLIKTKDVLENLLINNNVSYTNILPIKRGISKLSIFTSLIKSIFSILPILVKNRLDLLIGTDATIAQLGFLLRINRITIFEDDYDVIESLVSITYPFTQTILCPDVCDVGKWNNKKVGYNGYMKLGYLHPNVFKIDNDVQKNTILMVSMS
jgi:predicted glycosyltransferase